MHMYKKYISRRLFLPLVIFFLIAVPLLKLVTYPAVFLFRQGLCTITTKDIAVYASTQYSRVTYKAHIMYTVLTASGERLQAGGYDWFESAFGPGGFFDGGSPTRESELALLEKFAVGGTYTCWYNPLVPTQTVLTRDLDLSRLLTNNPLFRSVLLALGLAALALSFLLCLIWRRLIKQRTTPPHRPRRRQARRASRLRSAERFLRRDVLHPMVITALRAE